MALFLRTRFRHVLFLSEREEKRVRKKKRKKEGKKHLKEKGENQVRKKNDIKRNGGGEGGANEPHRESFAEKPPKQRTLKARLTRQTQREVGEQRV